jgi:hypothetical protein
MKAKENKNLKTKIGLKNLLVSKNQPTFKPKTINIQTINIEKNLNYFNNEKNFFSSKNMNNIRYIQNNNYNISTKNDYFLKKNRNSFFNSFDSERVPSPINSVGSSSYIPSGKKKFKRKRIHHKKNKYKYMNKNNSFHNLSFNTNTNTNISYIYSSSSSSEYENDNDYSDSSDASYKSRENKRKKYLDKMMVEENELDYLKRSEVGLISTDEEDNNNSMENSNSIEENFNNEIERILIEIYNKNISLISSGNCSEINKTNGEIEDIEKQIKKYLKRENLKTNLLVLRSLGNKIKELVGKYKEKVFEIEELKNLHNALQRQILNEQIYRNNNSLESNVATNSNSNGSLNNSYLEDENFLKNNLILNPQDELSGKGISHILLRELINIKRTLKISSKEIEGIFRYPLNILKDENGKKIKFSVELMQREEFCKILLNDELISSLLTQIKDIFSRSKNQEVTKWLLELDENYEHKNEMTRFIEYINDKLSIKKNNENKNDNSNYLEELKNKEEINEQNEKIYEKEVEEINKKIKKKRNKKIENNNKTNNQEEKMNELQFKDIDEILNYINDETDSKKGKKKCKKAKKNKNKKINKEEEKEKENEINKEKNNYCENEDLLNFEKEFQNFKEELTKDTKYVYEINNKIKPCLSENFLNQISII